MEKVYLREIEHADLPRINQWRNDPQLVELLCANFFFVGPSIDERWFDGYLANRDKAVRLSIVDATTQIHIGNVNLTGIQSVNRSAEFSIFIGDKAFWSAGYGASATRQMLAHGFNDLNLHRIYLTLLQENVRALRLYERMGFRDEGCQRDAVFKNGCYHNILGMGMLASDWLKTI